MQCTLNFNALMLTLFGDLLGKEWYFIIPCIFLIMVEDFLLCIKCHLFVFPFCELSYLLFFYWDVGFYRLVGIPNLLRISAIFQWYELQVLLPVCHLFFVFAYGICCCSLFLFGAFWKHVLVGWTVNILYLDFKIKSTSVLRISVEQ